MKRQHAILTLIVAAMAVLTAGCQKDKESVTKGQRVRHTGCRNTRNTERQRKGLHQ